MPAPLAGRQSASRAVGGSDEVMPGCRPAPGSPRATQRRRVTRPSSHVARARRRRSCGADCASSARPPSLEMCSASATLLAERLAPRQDLRQGVPGHRAAGTAVRAQPRLWQSCPPARGRTCVKRPLGCVPPSTSHPGLAPLGFTAQSPVSDEAGEVHRACPPRRRRGTVPGAESRRPGVDGWSRAVSSRVTVVAGRAGCSPNASAARARPVVPSTGTPLARDRRGGRG